jgi:hypothetical protein
VWAKQKLPLRHYGQGREDVRDLQEQVVPKTQRVQQNKRLPQGRGVRCGWGMLWAQGTPPVRSQVLALSIGHYTDRQRERKKLCGGSL